MQSLRSINQLLEKLEGLLISAALLLMIGLAFLQVLLRNAMDTGISWADPVVRALVVWVGFIGASMATRRKGHIQIDILSKFLPGRIKQITQTLVYLASAFVCLLLTHASYKFMLSEKEFGEMLTRFIPNWWVILILPISFMIMTLRFLLMGLTEFYHWLVPRPEATS